MCARCGPCASRPSARAAAVPASHACQAPARQVGGVCVFQRARQSVAQARDSVAVPGAAAAATIGTRFLFAQAARHGATVPFFFACVGRFMNNPCIQSQLTQFGARERALALALGRRAGIMHNQCNKGRSECILHNQAICTGRKEQPVFGAPHACPWTLCTVLFGI